MAYQAHIAWGGGSVFTGPNDDVSAHLVSFKVERGRDKAFSGQVPPGAADLVLTDPTGLWNPVNPGTAYATIRPGLACRIRYVEDGGGGTHDLYHGYIRRVEHTPHGGGEAGETLFQLHDAFRRFDNVEMGDTYVPGVVAPAGSVIDAYLDNVDKVGTPVSYLPRDITTTGGEIYLGNTQLDTEPARYPLLSIFGEFIRAEGGDLFISRGGSVTYRPLTDRLARSSSGTVTDVFSDARPSMDLDRVMNQVSVTIDADGGTTVTVDNATSQADYGVVAGQDITSRYINGTAAAETIGEWMTATMGSADAPLESLSLTSGWGVHHETSDQFQQMMDRDLGDRVTIISAGVGTADVFIDRITHQAAAGGVHETVWGVTPLPRYGSFGVLGQDWDPFTLDSSTLDGSDILVL